jgi:hypothetical protein
MQSSFAFIVSFTSPASSVAQDAISDEGEGEGEGEDDILGFGLRVSVPFPSSG